MNCLSVQYFVSVLVVKTANNFVNSILLSNCWFHSILIYSILFYSIPLSRFVFWTYRALRTPCQAEQTVQSLQSKGAPSDVSHKADVASLLIRGGRVSALDQKKKNYQDFAKHIMCYLWTKIGSLLIIQKLIL